MTATLNPEPYRPIPFNFERWQAETWARWYAVSLQLAARLREGFAIRETWPGGLVTVWSLEGNWRPDDPTHLWQPFIEDCMTPEYLAEHLANRAQGFGTTLSVEERTT